MSASGRAAYEQMEDEAYEAAARDDFLKSAAKVLDFEGLAKSFGIVDAAGVAWPMVSAQVIEMPTDESDNGWPARIAYRFEQGGRWVSLEVSFDYDWPSDGYGPAATGMDNAILARGLCDVAKLSEIDIKQSAIGSIFSLRSEVLAEYRKQLNTYHAYSSTALEGYTLTRAETDLVLNDGDTAIPSVKLSDAIAVKGIRNALDYIFDLAQSSGTVSMSTIRHLHTLVVSGQSVGGQLAGSFRTVNAMAAGSGHRYLQPAEIYNALEDLVSELNSTDFANRHPVKGAAKLHYDFVRIHPFADGNGRVARILLNLWLLRAGYPAVSFPPELQNKLAYINALETGLDAFCDLVCERVLVAILAVKEITS